MELVTFASSFIRLARSAAKERGITHSFSLRQEMSIIQLGMAHRLRNGSLDNRDLIMLAKVTTAPPYQKFAASIAERILNYENSQSIPPEKNKEMKQTTFPMMNPSILLPFTDRIEKIRSMLKAKYADSTSKSLFLQFERNLGLERSDVDSIVLGEGLAILNQMNSPVGQNALSIILFFIPDSRVLQDLHGSIEFPSASVDFLEELSFDLLSEFKKSIGLFMRISNQYNLPELQKNYKVVYDKVASLMIEKAPSLENLLLHPDILLNHKDKLGNHVYDMIKTFPLSKAIETAVAYDHLTQSDSLSLLIEMRKEELDGLALSEAIDLVELNHKGILDYLSDRIMEETANSSFQELINYFNELSTAFETTDSSIYDLGKKSILNDLKLELVSKAESFSDLQAAKKAINDADLQFPKKAFENQAQALDLEDIETALLMGDSFEIMKHLIVENKGDYADFKNLVDTAQLSKSQLDTLSTLAVAHRNVGAISVFLEKNFDTVIQTIKHLDDSMEVLSSSIFMSNGSNILNQWFRSTHEIPENFRSFLLDYFKHVFLEELHSESYLLGMNHIGGLLLSSTLRPFQEGDEFDQVDWVNTLEHIASSGKQLEDLSINDIIVRETEKGNRAVVMLVDISGSMDGNPIRYATITTAMTYFALAKEEFGLAFFESNTHYVCELTERRRNHDKIIDSLLNVRASKGTMIGQGLEWARDQFKQTSNKSKILLIITDALIYDLASKKTLLTEMFETGVKIYVFIPTDNFPYIETIGTLDFFVIPFSRWSDLPELVKDVLIGGGQIG